MANDKIDKLMGFGQIALGIGLVLKGIANTSGESKAGLLGAAPKKALPHGNVIEKVTTKRVGSIDARVEEIRKLILKGSLHPAIREKALEIVSKKCGDKWCLKEKSYQAEIDAIFWAIRDPKSKDAIRYVRDHATVDQFHGADKILKLHAADCDDYVVLLGSLLRSIGYPGKLRIMQAQGADSWSHIYYLCGSPPTNPTRWTALDASVDTATPGWQAPGAEECAKTGKPAGMTIKVRDYAV